MQSVTALAVASQLAVEKHRRCSADVLTLQGQLLQKVVKKELLRGVHMPDKGDYQSPLPVSLFPFIRVYPHRRLVPLDFGLALVHAQILALTVRPTSYRPTVEGQPVQERGKRHHQEDWRGCARFVSNSDGLCNITYFSQHFSYLT